MATNTCILCGNLTKEPEFLTTNNGISVCRFSIAVNRRFKNENGDTETDFINIVAWRGLADNCVKYLHKGDKVAVVGSLQTRNYEAKDGTKRYVVEVLADEVEFLTLKQKNDEQPKKQTEEQQTIAGFTPVEDDNLPF